MGKFRDKKVIAITIVLAILFISSIILYGKNRNKIEASGIMVEAQHHKLITTY